VTFVPAFVATEKCETCGRLVVDGSTDFGGVVLRPTCSGVRVSVNGAEDVFISESELRDFLARAYGPGVP
jgi:hypothetical protein